MHMSVVPYVGTWIEICDDQWNLRENVVVPYVGTWIEISIMLMILLHIKSFPTWERG